MQGHRQGQDAVLCTWLPNFMWQVESGQRQELKDPGQAALVTGESQDRSTGRVVLDHSPGLVGVHPGIPVGEALARYPGAALVEADAAHYQTVFDEVVSALEQCSPDVEDAGPGLAYVSLRGLERLYGNTASLVRMMAEAVMSVARWGMRIGVGPNKWLAHIAATTGRAGRARRITGGAGRFLDRLPVDLLPVSHELIKRLHGFGLTTLGRMADLPRGAMMAQFGREGGLAWDLANGFDTTPLIPRSRQETVSGHLDFPDPTVSLSAILAGIGSLLSSAYGRPLMQGRYARRASLHAQVLMHSPWTLDVAFREPAGAVSSALFGIKAKLDTVTFPGPLEDLGMSLCGLTGEAGRQESMWLDVKRDHDLRESLAQMQVRRCRCVSAIRRPSTR